MERPNVEIQAQPDGNRNRPCRQKARENREEHDGKVAHVVSEVSGADLGMSSTGAVVVELFGKGAQRLSRSPVYDGVTGEAPLHIQASQFVIEKGVLGKVNPLRPASCLGPDGLRVRHGTAGWIKRIRTNRVKLSAHGRQPDDGLEQSLPVNTVNAGDKISVRIIV